MTPRMLILLAILALLGESAAHGVAWPVSQKRGTAANNVLLEIGKPVERYLKVGEVHSYQIRLTAGEFINVVVDQLAGDVAISLFEPDGRQLTLLDSPPSTQRAESFTMIAGSSGSFRLDVRLSDNSSVGARYNASIKELRPAATQDRNRILATNALNSAMEFRTQGTLDGKLKAIERYEEALSLWREAGDQWKEAVTLDLLGQMYYSLRVPQKARDCYEEALALARTLRDSQLTARVLANSAQIHELLGEPEEAFENYKESLRLAQKSADQETMATILSHIGMFYAETGDRNTALDYYMRALSIKQTLGDRRSEAYTLTNIGEAYSGLGENKRALDYFDKALTLLRNLGDRYGQAATLGNIGVVYRSLNNIQEALYYYYQALQMRRSVGDRPGESSTLSNLGAAYDSLGDYRKALDYHNQAIVLRREIDDKRGQATSLTNIGATYFSIGEKRLGLESFFQALSLWRTIGDKRGEGTVLSNIAVAYAQLGDNQKALRYYIDALRLRKSIGDRNGEATTLTSIATLYFKRGETGKAIDYLHEALTLSRAVGDAHIEGLILGSLGKMYDSLGDSEKTLALYTDSIQVMESVRATATLEEVRTGFEDKSFSVYQEAILLLMRLGRPIQAFEMAEKARARMFLDRLGNLRPDIHKAPTVEIVKEEQALASNLSSLAIQLKQERVKPHSGVSAVAATSLENQLAAKRRAYEELLTRLKLDTPEYASLRTVATLSLNEAQQSVPKDTTLLVYFVTPEKTLIFLITSGSFSSVEVSVKAADLEAAAQWFLSFPRLGDPKPQSLRDLHDWLLTPVKARIKTRFVGVVPHGLLHYLPFAALTDGQRYFGDEHAIFYLPSASVLPFIQKKSKPVGAQMLAIAKSQAEGMPVLQHADEEAEAVAGLFSTRAFTAGNASKMEFLKRAGASSMLHIAAHAELNTANPLFSRIMLGGGKDDTGALEVREVYDLDLSNASLVVLSSCETQLGRQSQGDDIVGLNRAFIYAGTPTVVASLWTVDDESTSYLMKSFYTHLKRGLTKAEALQAAQKEARKKYPHPYYWAGFVLTGDPGLSSSK